MNQTLRTDQEGIGKTLILSQCHTRVMVLTKIDNIVDGLVPQFNCDHPYKECISETEKTELLVSQTFHRNAYHAQKSASHVTLTPHKLLSISLKMTATTNALTTIVLMTSIAKCVQTMNYSL